MREYIAFILFLSLLLPASAQTVPAGWKVVKDSKGACQIAVPPDWVPFTENSGAAVLHNATTAIAVVTSQPGQIFKPLSESQLKLFNIGKEKIFENTAKRLFYQDKTSRNPDDSSAYSAMVPGKGGTCSCHVVFVPSITEEIARKITLSLGAAQEPERPESFQARAGERSSRLGAKGGPELAGRRFAARARPRVRAQFA